MTRLRNDLKRFLQPLGRVRHVQFGHPEPGRDRRFSFRVEFGEHLADLDTVVGARMRYHNRERRHSA